MKKRLGQIESRILAYAQMRQTRVIRSGEFTSQLKLTAKQEREVFSRMARSQLIARVRPGLYLLPPGLPLGNIWSPSDALALAALMEDKKGRYQVCGPNAFNRYGFDEQMPNRTYAYNNRISGDRKIGITALTLIKVSDARLGDSETIDMADGSSLSISTRARTLVDAVYDWARFNTLPRAYGWIRRDLARRRVSAAELARITIRYGNQGTLRRMGALLESLETPKPLLTRLHSALKPSRSLIALVPNRTRKGMTNPRWGVIMNEGN
jgi:predicted transcriptional regulator of viral defense system